MITDEELEVLGEFCNLDGRKIIYDKLKTLEIIRKYVYVVNGQLIFKGISYKKNIKDYELLKEVLL